VPYFCHLALHFDVLWFPRSLSLSSPSDPLPFSVLTPPYDCIRIENIRFLTAHPILQPSLGAFSMSCFWLRATDASVSCSRHNSQLPPFNEVPLTFCFLLPSSQSPSSFHSPSRHRTQPAYCPPALFFPSFSMALNTVFPA